MRSGSAVRAGGVSAWKPAGATRDALTPFFQSPSLPGLCLCVWRGRLVCSACQGRVRGVPEARHACVLHTGQRTGGLLVCGAPGARRRTKGPAEIAYLRAACLGQACCEAGLVEPHVEQPVHRPPRPTQRLHCRRQELDPHPPLPPQPRRQNQGRCPVHFCIRVYSYADVDSLWIHLRDSLARHVFLLVISRILDSRRLRQWLVWRQSMRAKQHTDTPNAYIAHEQRRDTVM